MKFKYYPTKEELEQAYKDGKISLYILRDNKKYEVYYDAAKQSSTFAAQSAQMYLESYNMYLAKNYLIEQDINTEEF